MSRQRERIQAVADRLAIRIRQLICEPVGGPSEKGVPSGGWFLDAVDGTVYLGYNVAQLIGQMEAGARKHDQGIKVYLDSLELHFGEKVYRIGAGVKEERTPRGSFSILTKIRDPQTEFRDPDDEDNIGSRCMDFRWGKADGGLGRRLAIHGTSTPEKIRTNFTFGCVALKNGDVEELFDLVRVGEAVVIL